MGGFIERGSDQVEIDNSSYLICHAIPMRDGSNIP
jgi:hypothetical protein